MDNGASILCETFSANENGRVKHEVTIYTTDGRYTNHVVGELMISGKFPIANIAISRTAMIDVVIIVFTLQERSEAMGTFDLNCRSYWLFRAFFGL